MKRVLATLAIMAAAVLGLPAVSASAYTPPTVECFRAPCPAVPLKVWFPAAAHPGARFSWLQWAVAERNKARPHRAPGKVRTGRTGFVR